MLNVTNHPAAAWCAAQRRAARKLEPGREISDLAFPHVTPSASALEVAELADRITTRILTTGHRAVVCQGEFSLCFDVVARLQRAGIAVFAATSRREVREERLSDGSCRRHARFVFERFRRYAPLKATPEIPLTPG